MKINYCVRNATGNAMQKDYYFEKFDEAIGFAQKKSKRDKRNVYLWHCIADGKLIICSKILYLIRYDNGGTSRERFSA